MSLLDDLQNIAEHLSPSDVAVGAPVVGALIKVLEHEGVTVPPIEELLPEDHPARVSPPAAAPPQPGVQAQDAGALRDFLGRAEAVLSRLEGHSAADPGAQGGPAQAGSETSAPSSEPAAAPPVSEPPAAPSVSEPAGPELDRP